MELNVVWLWGDHKRAPCVKVSISETSAWVHGLIKTWLTTLTMQIRYKIKKMN